MNEFNWTIFGIIAIIIFIKEHFERKSYMKDLRNSRRQHQLWVENLISNSPKLEQQQTTDTNDED